MSQQENNANEISQKKGSRLGTTVVAIALLIGLAFFARWYFGSESTATQATEATAPQLPVVVIHKMEPADLAIERDYIGRVEPIQTVSILPQVAGEIAQVHFTEGSIVKAGDLLFTLDTKQYQATVDLRKADLQKAQANHKWATQYYNRLKASDKRSVSASDLESAENEVNQSRAAIAQAQASLKLAQIDLGYTKITAPITGEIGRAAFTKGNYVTPSTGGLATIVQVDPVRVTFSMPDKDYLENIEAFKSSNKSVYKTSLTLANGDPYPHGGDRDFEDNTMDSSTGTIQIRLRFKNDKGTLTPGAMVRVLTKPVESKIALVLPQEAIMADSEGDYVYVVDDKSIVHRRVVQLGKEVGQMTELVSGLEAGENVIIRGIQSVRPEAQVKALPLKVEGEGSSPAELAKESRYDLQLLPQEETAASKQATEKKEG